MKAEKRNYIFADKLHKTKCESATEDFQSKYIIRDCLSLFGIYGVLQPISVRKSSEHTMNL